jgi:hypothetical protein
MGYQPSQSRYLRTTTQAHKEKRRYMPQVGFELTVPLFERAKNISHRRPHGQYDRRVHNAPQSVQANAGIVFVSMA